MKMGAGSVAVELSGGPFCGHRTTLPYPINPTGIYLFHGEDGAAWAYEWANRSARKSGRWMLTAKCKVGTVGTGGGK